MIEHIPLLPVQASTHAADVDTLYFCLLAVSSFLALLIAALIVYFGIKYRRRSDKVHTVPTAGLLKLQLICLIAPLAIGILFCVWGAQQYFSWASPPADCIDIFVVAKQWSWKFQHAGGQRETGDLHIPVGQPVKLTMISQDVIHGFFVPAFRIQQDVLPERYTTFWFQAAKPGKYQIYCSQYCGTDHSRMIGTVVVMEQDAFNNWLDSATDQSMAARGRTLFLTSQCAGCHTSNTRSRAPVLEDLYSATISLQDGRSVQADETYLRESLLNPDAKVKAGFKQGMPDYKGRLNEEEIAQLITFIKSLQPGQTPRQNEAAQPPPGSKAPEKRPRKFP